MSIGTATPNQHDGTQPDVSDEGFVFVGQALALDLVNTEVVIRGRPRDLLEREDDVWRWWETAQRHHETLPLLAVHGDTAIHGATTHTAVLTLRGALRRLFSRLADGERPADDDLAALNAAMRQAAPAVRINDRGSPEQMYEISASPVHPLVVTVALAARLLLTTSDLQRLHRCGNARCILLFYDTTKSATRRWCSLGCMDRARSLRRYNEAKQARQP